MTSLFRHIVRALLFTYATNIQHRLYAALGCKRIIRDQGYLQSLNRPNVRLTFEHIARVEPDGVVTTTGIHLGFSLEVILNVTCF
jgi:hypothetical protein